MIDIFKLAKSKGYKIYNPHCLKLDKPYFNKEYKDQIILTELEFIKNWLKTKLIRIDDKTYTSGNHRWEVWQYILIGENKDNGYWKEIYDKRNIKEAFIKAIELI